MTSRWTGGSSQM